MIICIGDSIVNGYPFQRADSWPSILEEELLRETKYCRNIREETNTKFLNQGVDGETSEQVKQRFHSDVLMSDNVADSHLKAVFLSVGTNDFIYTDGGAADVLNNIREMETLLTLNCKMNAAQSCRLYLLAPLLVVPEMAGAHWMDGTDYNAVNRKLRELRSLLQKHAVEEKNNKVFTIEKSATEERGIKKHKLESSQITVSGIAKPELRFVDLQSQFAAWSDQVGAHAAYVDGIHPTREGYRTIASILKPIVKEL